MKHFRPFEFECVCRHDCGKGFAQMNEEFIEKLEFARLLSDVPYKLSSAFRCERHNHDIGGVEDSAHTKGHGADIRADTPRMRYKVLYGLIKAGFNRIGIYDTFIHVDDDPSKPAEVVWK